jgi:hypothetical protein
LVSFLFSAWQNWFWAGSFIGIWAVNESELLLYFHEPMKSATPSAANQLKQQAQTVVNC